MKISIARGTRGQPPGPRPDVLWEGEERQDGDEILPGALCVELIPWLELNGWHRFDRVKAGLPDRPLANEAPTGIQLMARPAMGKIEQTVEVAAVVAAHMMIVAALDLGARLEKRTKELWIRVR